MHKDIAIKVSGVYKNFKLPHEKTKSIKSLFTGFHKKRIRSVETQHALKDISFDIKKGEFFGIVGRNGSGKSTLLKLLAEIYQPSRGTIQHQGKLVPFIELGVGFNPELTGRENIYLNGALLGFTRKEIDEQYDDIVAFSELEEFMDQKLKNYSSGMQVRLAFSVATRAKSDILLVDEVLAVGDADFQRKCFNYFQQLKKSDTTVVFVSHDMNAVREYCNRALLIDKSEVVCEGSAEKVAAEYAKLFLETEDTETGDDSEERWGDRSATIEAPSVKIKNSQLEIQFRVIARVAIDDMIVGFSITNEAGDQLFGTNTQILHQKIAAFKAGESRRFDFAIPNVFADGSYVLTLAVLRSNGSVTADWWVKPVPIVIKKAEQIPYILDVPVSLDVQKV